MDTPIFDWYVVKYGYENGYQNYMCSKETNLHVQNMLTVLKSILQHHWGDLHGYLMNRVILILVVDEIFIQAPKMM